MVKPNGGGLESQKTKSPAKATSGFGGMEIPPGSFWGWSLFHAVQITVSSTALSWGGNEMNSAQSPVFHRSGPFFPKNQKTKSPAKATVSLRRHGIPFWQFWGLVPFPYSSNQSSNFPLSWGGNELNSVQSPVFVELALFFTKKH